MLTVEQLIRESIGEGATVEKVASAQFDKNEAQKISSGLTKIASLPYNEKSYNSVCEIIKIASRTLDAALEEIGLQDSKVKDLEKVSVVRDLIDQMLDLEIICKDEVQEKTAELVSKTDKDLDITKEAIKINSGMNSSMFFEKAASYPESNVKRGMFDGVLD